MSKSKEDQRRDLFAGTIAEIRDRQRLISVAKQSLSKSGYIVESMRDDQVFQVVQNFYPDGWRGFVRDNAE